MGNLEICKCGMTNNHPDFYSHNCEFSSSTPTTKDGQTIHDLMSELRRHAVEFGGIDISTAEYYEQAIEALIAERERLARIDELQDCIYASTQEKFAEYLIQRRKSLQAQSGSEEENGQ